MEMNTRLQVEHPVTEMVTGLDLVEQQVRIAAGRTLPIAQDDVALTGHAIEARVYAEDPARGFLPDRRHGARRCASRPGPASASTPGSRAARWIGSDYDPMLAKVIAHGADRAGARCAASTPALARHRAARASPPTSAFLRVLLADPDVRAGESRHRAARPAAVPTWTRRSVHRAS